MMLLKILGLCAALAIRSALAQTPPEEGVAPQPAGTAAVDQATALPFGGLIWQELGEGVAERWFTFDVPEGMLAQAMIEGAGPEDAAALDWSLHASGDKTGEPGRVLDGAAADDRRFSLWFPAGGSRLWLHVRLRNPEARATFRAGFDLRPGRRDAAGRLLPTVPEGTTPTRFRDSHFKDTTTEMSLQLLFEAKLERDTLFNYDIPGEYIYFQVRRNGVWQTLPDDGITISSPWTDGEGIGSTYWVLPPDLSAGVYRMRVVYDGSPEYGPCTREMNLTVTWPVSYLLERTPHVVGSGRVPLILVHGNGGEDAAEGNWTHPLNWIRDHPEDFSSVDVYVWHHNTRRALGFNGYTGNAAELANVIYHHILPDYPPGTKVVLMAHSRGGLTCRAFMNHASQGDDVAGLITLGTPHHGSPFAVPDWCAISWALRMGNSAASRSAFNLLVSRDGKGFDIDRLGSLNLAWDNLDGVIGGWASLPFDINFATGGQVKVSYRDLNLSTAFSDETIMYSDLAKSLYGTLRTMNLNEGYRDRLITYAAYDNNLGDNPAWNNMIDVVVNLVGSVFNDHYALSAITRLLAYMSDQVAFNSANYVANDGMVPLQSALFLNIGGGVPFAQKDASEQVTVNWSTVNSRMGSAKYSVWTGGIRDHLDLLDTTHAGYWSAIAGDIRNLAKKAACLTPPEYNYTISPGENWTTSGSFNVIGGGCRIYRMYLWDDTAYDFSLCSNDGRGGFTQPGDGDLEMFDAGGQRLWYIDGSGSCGWDASTLGTIYEGWSPPTSGYYYLRVSEFYDEAMTYRLAFKGRIKRGHLTVTLQPPQAVAAGAQWRLAGDAWMSSGSTIHQLWIGWYTVEYRSIPGWIAPPAEGVEILDQQTARLTGTYLADCNGNQLPDADELAGGAADCNGNQWLDACEPDSDGDGTIDGCDRCPGHDDRADADGDGVPDGCDRCARTIPGVPVDAQGCPVTVGADLDRDGDVDLDDFALLQPCLSGFGVPQTDPACGNMHLAGRDQIDAQDVAILRNCLSGANVPADPGCIPR